MNKKLSSQNSKIVIVLPYFCSEEIDRYLLTADWLQRNCPLPLPCDFLLASSPQTNPCDRMLEAFSKLGSARAFQCPTQVFGYPQGPTAMFWDCMDFVGANYAGKGFSLWFESDMAVTKSDWLSRLEADWNSIEGNPLLMGLYIPEVYKFRWLRQRKKILDPHINGGACYALDFVHRMPSSAREGVFDMAIYESALKMGGVKRTEQIAFSTLKRVRRDVMNEKTCVLHGFMQDKDKFVRCCVEPITEAEKRNRFWHPVHDQIELTKRRLSVCFFRKGRRAVLENVLLAQQRLQHD